MGNWFKLSITLTNWNTNVNIILLIDDHKVTIYRAAKPSRLFCVEYFVGCQFVLNGGPIGEPVVLAGLSFGGHRMEEFLVTLHFGRFVLWLV